LGKGIPCCHGMDFGETVTDRATHAPVPGTACRAWLDSTVSGPYRGPLITELGWRRMGRSWW